MKNRNSFLLLGLAVLAAFVIAAAPDFSNFDTTQFGGGASSVSIKSGFTFTNGLIDETGGIGYSLTISDRGAGGNWLYVKDALNVPQFILSSSGVFVNSLTANTLVKANGGQILTSVANGTGTLFNDGSGGITFVDTLTNALPTASTFPVTSAWPPKQYLTNLAGGLTFTSVAGTDPNRVTQGVAILLPNGADRTLTLPADWVLPDGIRTITVTNGVTGVLSINCFGTKRTNATYRAYY